MAGEARTSAFMLGSATVMIGPQAALWDLNVDEHSIGLVKNFSISTEPTYAELTQGAKANIVYSVLTANPVRAQMEVFEYTSKNLSYGLGLDGSALVPISAEYLLSTGITGNTGTPVSTATFVATESKVAEFPIGKWVSIQDPVQPDKIHYAKLSATTTVTGSAPTITHTLTFTGFGLKTGNNFGVGSRVQAVSRVDVGSNADQPFLAAKIVGILPEKNESVALLIPKMRITRGFTLAFTTENFGNLPFQFQPYDLVATDPFYAEFRDRGPVAMMTGT
jgi:hypothetical protein